MMTHRSLLPSQHRGAWHRWRRYLEKDAAEAIELIKKTDAIAICRKKAEEMIDKALIYLDVIPESKYKDSLIGLAKYIVSRDR